MQCNYQATGASAISLSKGDVVEMVESSDDNEWALVRTVGKIPREGWIPKDLIVPCSFSGTNYEGMDENFCGIIEGMPCKVVVEEV